MAKNNTGKFALGALIAGVAGYVTGILTAPKSGQETRQDIKNKTDEVKTKTEMELHKAEAELREFASKASKRGSELSGRAKADLAKAQAKAKRAQLKATAVLKAARAGKAKDPELNTAVKQVREAKKHLAKFLKS